MGVHPDGVAAERDDFNVSFEPEADLPGIATAAGGAWGRTVRQADEVKEALAEALAAVSDGRSAVLSVHLPPVQPGPPSQRVERPLARERHTEQHHPDER